MSTALTFICALTGAITILFGTVWILRRGQWETGAPSTDGFYMTSFFYRGMLTHELALWKDGEWFDLHGNWPLYFQDRLWKSIDGEWPLC